MSVHHLVETYGYAAVFFVVFLESVGIPFPGEIMLITAAAYAASGHLQIPFVILAAIAGAVFGGAVGYAVGRRFGRVLVLRYGRYIRLEPARLRLVERFFNKHGDKTVLIGRFVALLRAWAAVLAGINNMPWQKYATFNTISSVVWATLYGYLAFKAGENIPLSKIGLIGLVVLVAGAIILFVLKRLGFDVERFLLGEEDDPAAPVTTGRAGAESGS